MSDKPAEKTNLPEQYSGDNVRASWPFSLDAIRSHLAHCTPDRKEAMISVFLWCTDPKHPVTRNDFCDASGIDRNTLYKVLTGRYRHPASDKQLDIPTEVAKAARDWLVTERRKYTILNDEFVITPTARKIFTACQMAGESKRPVFLFGRSQLGKTWALKYFADKNNHGHTVYVRVKAASGLGGLIRMLARALGVSDKSNTCDTVERIKNAIRPDMIIIFDEVHQLAYTYRRASFFACLEVIREIIDETGCGAVLCGTKLLLQEMNKGKESELEQLMRRGVHRFQLPEAPTRADLNAIFHHYGLDFPKRNDTVTVQRIEEKPYLVLKQLAMSEGLLAITERLRYARKLADRAGESLSWEHFIDAHLTVASERIDDGDWN